MTESGITTPIERPTTHDGDLPLWGHWIDGAFHLPDDADRFDVRSPATGHVIARLPVGTADGSVALAAAAAQRALDAGWRDMDALDRGLVLRRMADVLAPRLGAFAELESQVTGRPVREMRAQMARIPEWLHYFAGLAPALEAESNVVKGGFLTYTAYEPLGVVALLTPWNHPLLILIKKLAAALAAGNTCIVKPSELAPISPIAMARLFTEAGLPNGVINVIAGEGATGAAVCDAGPVARIDLTGGTETGRKVAAAAGKRLIPCTLELGGKAPVIVFDDVDLDQAVAGATFSAFIAAGQTCVSGTRFLVHRPIYDAFVERFASRAKALRVGDPMAADTDMGPVISRAAQRRCLEHIAEAQAQGARLVAGGVAPDVPAPFDRGNYVAPTVFADVTPRMRLFREEVFGPVVAVTPFEDEAEALALANDTAFALGASLWTRDVARAHRLSLRVRAGVLWVNDHHKNDPRSLWGGFGDSGYGKENGWDALRGYLRKRSVVVATQERFGDWFAGGHRYG